MTQHMMTDIEQRACESKWYESGRLDVDGVRWYVTDPYPTWYRRDDGLIIDAYKTPDWADDE